MNKSVKIISIFSLLLFSSNFGKAQIGDLNKFWQPIGPNSMPDNSLSISAAGIGPIEFIRVHPTKPGYLLAGSLNGGLFYSENGGELWNNAGSDAWDYSACAWADFHPNNHEIWFACSNESGDNGGAGKIKDKGGLMRTINSGTDWELIGDYHDFGGSERTVIYGTRFHPWDANLILVLTSDGLYYTESSLLDNITWQRVPNIRGWVYDIDFVGGSMFVTNFNNKKWALLKFNQDDLMRFETIEGVVDHKEIKYLTIEPFEEDLLVLKVFSQEKDEVWRFNPNKNTHTKLVDKQQVSFGFGRTFAVNPHKPTEFYLGNSTKMGKWNPPYERNTRIDVSYHSDVEFIAFDPFDSLKVYIATHGGVYITYDAAKSWEHKSENLGNAEVMGMSVSRSDPNQIVIGTYHDGSSLRADFNNNGIYFWKTVNGGDGLIPLIDQNDNGIVYTSTQYAGGGLYYSSDTLKTKPANLHSKNGLKSAGWEMAAALHGILSHVVYFNFVEKNGTNKDNIDICRLTKIGQEVSVEEISDFNASHKIEKYKVYGLFTSKYSPNTLIAYVLDYTTDSNGKPTIVHRLFRNDMTDQNPMIVLKSWVELQTPKNSWIGDVEIDAINRNIIYLTYTKGKSNAVEAYDRPEMIYKLKYKSVNSYMARRKIDISGNIPNETAGRYNLVYTNLYGGGLFVATKTGVYFGTKKTLKGRNRWSKIGNGLPHCKIYGLDFNEEYKTLTVGLFGRGVWQYNF